MFEKAAWYANASTDTYELIDVETGFVQPIPKEVYLDMFTDLNRAKATALSLGQPHPPVLDGGGTVGVCAGAKGSTLAASPGDASPPT